MIISRQELTSKGRKEYDEDIVFPPEEVSDNPLILSAEALHAHVETEYVAHLTIVKIVLSGQLTLRSTRTLRPVPYALEAEDELVLCYSRDALDPDSMILFTEEELDLRPYFYSLLITSLPLQVISPEDESEIRGENWEVLTEDEYYRKKRDAEEDSPFAELKNWDTDE